MNSFIASYFDGLESLFIGSDSIRSFRIIRRQVSTSDGKLRVRIILIDDSEVELFEYVTESGGKIELRKYSFHWQTNSGALIRRWDNAPHHPSLPGEPHHVHQTDGSVAEVLNVPDTAFVISYIEDQIKQ